MRTAFRRETFCHDLEISTECSNDRNRGILYKLDTSSACKLKYCRHFCRFSDTRRLPSHCSSLGESGLPMIFQSIFIPSFPTSNSRFNYPSFQNSGVKWMLLQRRNILQMLERFWFVWISLFLGLDCKLKCQQSLHGPTTILLSRKAFSFYRSLYKWRTCSTRWFQILLRWFEGDEVGVPYWCHQFSPDRRTLQITITCHQRNNLMYD